MGHLFPGGPSPSTELRTLVRAQLHRRAGGQFGQHDALDQRVGGQLAVADPGVRADVLDRHLHRALELGGVRWGDGLVDRRPHRHPGRARGRLVAGVQPRQQRAGRGQLLAPLRALGRRQPGGQVGDGRAVVRGAEGEHPAGLSRAAVGGPQPGDDAAGRVADDVDAARTGAPQRVIDRGAQHVGGRVEVAGALAGHLHHGGVATLGAEPFGQCQQGGGGAAVPGHQEDGARRVVLRRGRRRGAAGDPGDDDGDRHRGGRHQQEGQQGEHEATAGGGEAGEHPTTVPRRGPPRGGLLPVLSRDEYLVAWSRWHGDADPAASRLVHGWLTLAYTLAVPLARVPPLAATALGLVVAGAAVGPAVAGGTWLIATGVLIGLSGLLDSLDGALAIAGGRASRRGFVLDSAVDRLTEGAYAVAFWAAGAPGWLAAAFGALCWLPDYLRARAGQAGVHETGAISVWERPTRVAMAGFSLGGAGIVAGTGLTDVVVTSGAAVGCLLGLVGTAQLGVQLRRALGDDARQRPADLGGPPRAGSSGDS